MSVRILIGDCRERLLDLPDASVDSVVCDPPYHLTSIVKRFGAADAAPAQSKQTGVYARSSKGFMGQTWDGGDVAFDPDTWVEVLRVLKPGGHLVAFSGTRTYHRMVCAIEDAGFEVRDQLAWIYGSGFPKSLDVSKQIDKAAGAEREVVGLDPQAARRNKSTSKFSGVYGTIDDAPACPITAPATEAAQQWQGWGTALKPAWEPICLARKPLDGTVAGNVLTHGTGALNIDGCRVEHREECKPLKAQDVSKRGDRIIRQAIRDKDTTDLKANGRWPANLCHDGSDEVLAGFPDSDGQQGDVRGDEPSGVTKDIYGQFGGRVPAAARNDSGSAARFFYCAKATTDERGEGNNHPTVKPIALMRWLCRLITPKGGTVLDPFMGSGSTGIAADAEQFNFIGCELSADYAEIARGRIAAQAGMFAEIEVVHAPTVQAA